MRCRPRFLTCTRISVATQSRSISTSGLIKKQIVIPLQCLLRPPPKRAQIVMVSLRNLIGCQPGKSLRGRWGCEVGEVIRHLLEVPKPLLPESAGELEQFGSKRTKIAHRSQICSVGQTEAAMKAQSTHLCRQEYLFHCRCRKLNSRAPVHS